MTGIEKLGNMTVSQTMIQSAIDKQNNSKFAEMLKKMQEKNSENNAHISSEQIIKDGRLNGDYATGFDGTFTSKSDKASVAQGAARNGGRGESRTIDKTSRLYEKSMELESFFVKQMLSSMRKTLNTEGSGFGKQMYEDMLYDEYATAMTKNAGFGIADQIYLELSRNA